MPRNYRDTYPTLHPTAPIVGLQDSTKALWGPNSLNSLWDTFFGDTLYSSHQSAVQHAAGWPVQHAAGWPVQHAAAVAQVSYTVSQVRQMFNNPVHRRLLARLLKVDQAVIPER